MKRILLLVLMLVIFITPCTFATGGKVYENQHYKITFPEGWQINDQEENIVEACIPGKFPRLSIHFRPIKLGSETTIENVDLIATGIVERLKKEHPDMILIDKDYLKISNRNALRIIVLDLDKNFFILYFIPKNDCYFGIMAIGDFSNGLDKDQKNIEQIISTFTFID